MPSRSRANPRQARLISVVRDPLTRLEAHYAHLVVEGRETRSLAEMLADPDNTLVSRSRYWMQLERYLPLYPAGGSS